MKKILLFVNFLLLLTLSASAQIPQYSISATPVTAIGSDYPFNSYPTGSKVQWLFLNTQFPTAPSGFITKIYVKSTTATVNATYTNFEIKIGQTTAAVLSTNFVTAGMNSAFASPVHVIPVTTVNDWVEFALTTPIPYNNTQNLIVEVAHDGFLNGFNQRHGSVNNRRTYDTNPNTTGTLDGYMPDFGFDIALPCNKIDYTTIQKNNITTTSVDLSWATPGASTIAYEYELDQLPTNPPSVGYITTTTPSLSFNNLTPGTCYYIHLRTNCDPNQSLLNKDTSGWVIDSFCTLVDCVVPEVTIDRIDGTTAVASWQAVPTVLSYEYSVGTTPIPPTNGVLTTYTSVKLQGLMPNAPLYFFLKSYCSVVPQSPWGNVPFHTTVGTSVGDIASQTSHVLFAYPNPVADVMKLRVYAEADATLTITDITGKVLQSFNNLTEEMNINMTNMPAGIYLVKYSSSTLNDVIRVNKQ